MKPSFRTLSLPRLILQHTSLFPRIRFLSLAVGCFVAGHAFSDDTPPLPVVVKVGQADVIGIHKKLTVEATGLPAWAEKNDASKIVLYLDGMPLRGIAPRTDRLQPPLNAADATRLRELIAQKASPRSESEEATLVELRKKYKTPLAVEDLGAIQELAMLKAKATPNAAEQKRLAELTAKYPTPPTPEEVTDQLNLQKLAAKAPLTATQEAELAKLQTGSLEFVLDRISTEPDNIAAWNSLMSRPTGADFNGHSATARVSLGFNDHLFPLDQDLRVPIQKLSKVGIWLVIILCLGLIWAVIELARRSNLLRDGGPAPASGKMRPFSLGRTQMAFWFVLVVASFVSIWLATGALDTLTSSVLGLIGISAATGFAAVLVDNSKRQSLEDALKARQDEKTKYLKDNPGADKLTPADPGLATINGKIDLAEKALTPLSSEDFFLDILTDDTGVNLHRMQIVVWTVVAGIVFVASVYNSLSMPEFSPTLLGLMGISGGTYIGFKIPEKQTDQSASA